MAGKEENKKTVNKRTASKRKTKAAKQEKPKSILDNVPKRKQYDNKLNIKTHEGHKLTVKEAKFIQNYVETGNGRQSVIDAGYKMSSKEQYAQELLSKQYIASEINYRLAEMKKDSIATADEILEFYTKVMRGEVKDQFGLEAQLGDRIKAGNELAKRLVDIPNKLEGKAQATVTISLDWEGMEDTGDGEEEHTE